MQLDLKGFELTPSEEILSGFLDYWVDDVEIEPSGRKVPAYACDASTKVEVYNTDTETTYDLVITPSSHPAFFQHISEDFSCDA